MDDGVAFFSPSKRLKLNRNSYAVVTNFASTDGGIDRESSGTEESIVRSRNCFPSTTQDSHFTEEDGGDDDDDDDDDDGGFCEETHRRGRLHEHSRRPPCLLDVTSTNDRLCAGDLQDLCLSNGGDSGFNDFTPPSSDMETSGLDLEEPDSSTAFVPCPAACLGDNDDEDEDDEDGGDADESASTVSHLSGFSDLSEMSGQDWKPTAGPMSWIQRQMMLGISPRILLQQILPQDTKIPDRLDDLSLWKMIVQLMNEPRRRRKLRHVNTFDDVLGLVRRSRRVIVLTGAGVSVSCGIPDFRSHDGIYARLAKDFPDLPDPQAMFDIQYFRRDPRPFYKFAKEIYPGLFQPSPCHRFIKFLEASGKLLRNYTQNIDTLEQIAGIQNVIECHGSFATASCMRCKHKVNSAAVRDDIFNQTIPHCPKCTPDADELAIMKPDIVFFGEGLSDEFHSAMNVDKDRCDLLIVIGSSLKVRPVALIPSSVPGDVPQILINRERLPHLNFDVELLGDCDVIINEICRRLGDGWNHLCYRNEVLTEVSDLSSTTAATKVSSVASSKSSDVSSKTGKEPFDSTSFPRHFAVDNRQCNSTEAPSSSSRSVNPADSTVELEAQAIDSPCSSEPHVGPQLLRKPQSISTFLPENSYLFCPPSRYIFHGAEVYELADEAESDDEDNDDDQDESSQDGDGETASSSPSSNENTSDVSIYEMDRMSFSPDPGTKPCDEDVRDNLSR